MKSKRLFEYPKSLRASMTLEASVALPLFIFFFLNIMSVIWMIQIQSDIEAVIHQVGSDCMQMAFDIREGESMLSAGDDGSVLDIAETGVLSGYAISKVRSGLSDKLKRTPVMDGVESLSFISSKVLQGNDIIDIVVDYKVHPIVGLVAFSGFNVESRFYGHAWTGYDIERNDDADAFEEEIVYITEHGEVYHRDVSCKYLKSGLQSVNFSEVNNLRNNDRSKYYPCEYCGEQVKSGAVFVTPYGTRYHSKVDCQGLKRKIYSVPISEVLDRRPCSVCGG